MIFQPKWAPCREGAHSGGHRHAPPSRNAASSTAFIQVWKPSRAFRFNLALSAALYKVKINGAECPSVAVPCGDLLGCPRSTSLGACWICQCLLKEEWCPKPFICRSQRAQCKTDVFIFHRLIPCMCLESQLGKGKRGL